MKRLFKLTCYLMAFIFTFFSFSQSYNTESLFARAEEEETEEFYDIDELPYADMLSTYYTSANNDVTTTEENDGSKTLVADGAYYNDDIRFEKRTEHLIKNNRIESSTYTDVASGNSVKNEYTYDTYGHLTSLINGGVAEYKFEYDGENLISAAHNGNTQFRNTYDSNGNLICKEYANGDTVEYVYDSSERLKSIIVNGECVYNFSYSGDGETDGNYSITRENLIKNITTEYYYDGGDLVNIIDGESGIIYSYDECKIIEKTYNYFSSSQTVSYDGDNVRFNSASLTYEYEDNRIKSKLVESDYGFSLNSNIGYASSYDERPLYYETNSSFGSSFRYDYVYDEACNLASVYSSALDNLIKYEYNANDQLISEWNNGTQYYYNYDERGNIISKTVSGGETLNVEYDENDRLIRKSEETISYDDVGNPLNYNGYSLTWTQGRTLSQMQKDNNLISYAYDSDGYRTEKTVNGKTTYYVYDGDKVIYEKTDDYLIYYLYGKNDELIGFDYDEGYGVETYYYIKDGLNNVTAIVDPYGEIAVYYNYDAYGNVSIYGISDYDKIGNINPYRYRGYRYDEETGLYFLNSRYYDPEIARFINADDIAMVENYSIGTNYNLFAYAYNNPVKYSDANGDVAVIICGISISSFAICFLSAFALIAFMSLVLPGIFKAIRYLYCSQMGEFIEACKKIREDKRKKSKKTNIHHIVAKTAKDAEPSREVLEKANIKVITDSRNLVEIKESFHQYLHTRRYYNAVNAFFKPFKTKGDKYLPEEKQKICNILLSLKVVLAVINMTK